MRIFVTGASGFIGSAVVPELIQAGHRVVGLARSDASARAIEAAGGEVLRGDLVDVDRLRAGAVASDGVIHLGFIHDFENFAAAAEVDRHAVETFGSALEGSDRPLVIAAGTLGLAPGRVATERDAAPAHLDSIVSPRLANVQMALSFVPKGVRTVMV
jgi:nucleoside-diphosphate-sugar epimerase